MGEFTINERRLKNINGEDLTPNDIILGVKEQKSSIIKNFGFNNTQIAKLIR